MCLHLKGPGFTSHKRNVSFRQLHTRSHIQFVVAFCKKLKRLSNKAYPMARLNIVFKPAHRIGYFFKFKDSIPLQMRSSVIYNFRCASCSASYIGQTSRHFKTRISEHKGLSPKTSKALLSPPHSNIREHCLETGHHFSDSDFAIINSGRNRLELNILETLHIKHSSPSLNNMHSSTSLKNYITFLIVCSVILHLLSGCDVIINC